jgi:hypothetical protein
VRQDPSVSQPGGIWALDMVSASDGWAVGMDGLILRYDGNA